MDDNREQELEQRVDELEATVRGLTEELVDLNERVRCLEEDADLDTDPAHASSLPDPETVADDETDPTPTEEADSDEEEAFEDTDDIIVA